jgi:hypothetical protein
MPHTSVQFNLQLQSLPLLNRSVSLLQLLRLLLVPLLSLPLSGLVQVLALHPLMFLFLFLLEPLPVLFLLRSELFLLLLVFPVFGRSGPLKRWKIFGVALRQKAYFQPAAPIAPYPQPHGVSRPQLVYRVSHFRRSFVSLTNRRPHFDSYRPLRVNLESS